MGDRMEALEDEVLLRPTADSLRSVYRAKHEFMTLRRAVWPQREAINAIIRDENAFIGDTARVYLRDTYDHCVQVIDILASHPSQLRSAVSIVVYSRRTGSHQADLALSLPLMECKIAQRSLKLNERPPDKVGSQAA